VALTVAVPIAWFLEGGVWSLVWGYLAGNAAGALILVIGGWWSGHTRPLFRFRRADLAGYLGFGLYRTGAMSANFFNLRVAQLFVGALLGAQALGYYSVATNLVLQPVQKLNPVLTRVAFPIFSEIQDDVARLRRGYLQMVHLLMLLSAPVLIGVAAVAPTAVPLLLGERWTEAVPLVQVLAFYALLRSLGNAGGSLLMARGWVSWSFYWNVVMLLVIPPVVFLASLGGDVIYVAWSLVVVQVLLFLVSYRVSARNLSESWLVPYVKAAGVPVLLAGVMGVVVLGVGMLLVGLPEAARLTFQVLAGVLSYAALAWVFQGEYLRSVLKLVRARS
jgi:O-antigen/teichoic acid export membrane protein